MSKRNPPGRNSKDPRGPTAPDQLWETLRDLDDRLHKVEQTQRHRERLRHWDQLRHRVLRDIVDL